MQDISLSVLQTLVDPLGPGLLILVAAFYLCHAPRELCRLWRFHNKRCRQYWAERRHFRSVVEMVIAAAGSLIIVSPVLYHLMEAMPVTGLQNFT